MTEDQIKELTETTARSKSNTYRIDNLEQQNKIMHEMNRNIAVIAEQTKDTKEDVKGLKCDVTELKSKGAKHWDMIIDKGISVIIGTILGAIMAYVVR